LFEYKTKMLAARWLAAGTCLPENALWTNPGPGSCKSIW
jgi:hypothetical protein